MFAYAIFFATFLYLICFVGNLPFAPLTVDRGPEAPVATAVVIDLVLIAMFGIQHSVMARQGFKRAWTRVVPLPAERSVYVLMASAGADPPVHVLAADRRHGLGGHADRRSQASAVGRLFALGWLIVLLSTFLINHFELFGLQQAWFHMRGRAGRRRRNSASPYSTNGPPPALSRLLPRLLGDAAHDLRPSAAGGGHVGLYADRDPLRGARPRSACSATIMRTTAQGVGKLTPRFRKRA